MVNSNRVSDFGPQSMPLFSEEVDITNNFARDQLGLLVPSNYFKIVKKIRKKGLNPNKLCTFLED